MRGLTPVEAEVLAILRDRDAGLRAPCVATDAQVEAAYALVCIRRALLVPRECGHPDCKRLVSTPEGREALRIHEAIAVSGALAA